MNIPGSLLQSIAADTCTYNTGLNSCFQASTHRPCILWAPHRNDHDYLFLYSHPNPM